MLDGIPPAPRGVPQIEVTFDLDASGILNVTAKDKATNKEQKITISGSTGLDKDEVERMTKEAEANAEEDRKKKEEIEVKNQADTLVYTAEKALKDAGDKVPADVKTEVEEKIKAVKDAQNGSDLDVIKSKTEELSATLQKIGSAMYQGSEGSEQSAGGEEPKSENGSPDAKESAVEGEVVDEGGDADGNK